MDARNLTAIPHSDAGRAGSDCAPMGMRAIRWSSHHGYPELSLQMALSSTNRNSSLSVREVDNSWRGWTHAIRARACGDDRIQSAP